MSHHPLTLIFGVQGFQGPSTLPVSSQPSPADKPPKVSSERSGRPSRFGPEPTHSIPPPPQSQPQAEEHVWLTREESQRLERDAERNELYGQVKSPVLARKQNEPYTRLRPGDRPQRQYEQPQGPPQQMFTGTSLNGNETHPLALLRFTLIAYDSSATRLRMNLTGDQRIAVLTLSHLCIRILLDLSIILPPQSILYD
ncbi:hypothetical protein EIP86_008275 [Pleurotus ostreatoroseus]|nr:hypothetical protein EIP86_008275 [Pleurotus ostreatoroseus]